MSSFTNLSIKTRLTLIVTIPLLGLLYFSISSTIEKAAQSREMTRLSSLIELSVRIGALAHEMQKERGMTAGFLSSKGVNFANELPAQRKETDKRGEELMTQMKSGIDISAYGTAFKEEVDTVMKDYGELGAKRDAINKIAILTPEAIGYYSKTIGKLLDITANSSTMSSNGELARLGSSYTAWMMAKERAGQERAILAGVFSADKFNSEMLARFLSNSAAQDVFLKVFQSYATDEQKAFYKSKVVGPDVDEVTATKKAAQDKASEPSLGMDAGKWFKAATGKINLMKAVEDNLAEGLITTTNDLRGSAQRMMFFYILLSASAIIITLLFAMYMIRNILRQLGGEPEYAAEVAGKIAAGDLSMRVKATGGSNTSVLAAMKTMQESLSGLVKEIQVVVEASVQGDFSKRIEIAGKQGFGKQIGEALNQLSQTTNTSLSDIQRVAGALAQGDLSQKISNNYPGTFGDVANGMNATVGALSNVINEIQAVVNASVQGDFTQRIEINGKTGFSKTLSEALNELSQTTSVAMADIQRVANALAQGDLTQNISKDYPGTIGEVKNGINETVQNLTHLVVQIKDAVDAINTAANEIAAGNQDLSQRTEEQASSLEETASSMEQLTSTVKQNAESAKQANQLAKGSSDVAGRGGAVVGEVVHTMSAINESSRKIVEIISVIDGIAFQTNILALNAAVEAARAGEQGRGFAVVAGEVRNLAQRSAAAAKEIKTLIGNSVEKVEGGAKLVEQAGQTMEEIVTSIKRVTDIMGEISAASVEQSSGIEQVNQAITQMDEVTQQNAALVEEAAAAAESLQEQAQNLSTSVSVFKLSNTGLANRPAPTVRTAVATVAKATPAQAARKAVSKPAGSESEDEWAEF